MNPPLVLGVHPVRGWRQADLARRGFAVIAVALIAAWPLIVTIDPVRGDSSVAVTALTVGPPAFYSAARVLRPHLTESLERRLRHALSSASTAFGVALLMSLWAGGEGAATGLLVVPASFGLLVTVPWGIAALVWRAVRTPVQPRIWPSPVTT